MIYLTLSLTFFNFVTSNAARVVLSLYSLELGASASQVGLLGGIFYLFPLLLSWPVGTMADRFGSRGLLLFAAVCGTLSLAIPYLWANITAFYVAAALNGLALAFFHVTLQNLIGILSKPEERPRNFSNFSLMGAITVFVGPLFAGFGIDHFGHAWTCLYLGLLPLLGGVIVAIWGRRYPPGNPEASSDFGGLSTLKDAEVRRMLLTSGLVQLGTDLFQFYIPIYGHEQGLSASAIGAILASFATASFVVRIFLARLIKAYPAERLLVYSFVMGAVGFALAPFFHSALLLGVIAFVFGLGMGCGTPLTVILMFSRSAQGKSGQTLGLRLTSNNLVRAVGPIVFGALGAAMGLPVVFWLSGAAMLYGAASSVRRPR